jgi:hypothetical protein
MIEWGFQGKNGHSGGFASMSMAMGATAASLSIDVRTGNDQASVMRTYDAVLAASDLLQAKYACDNGSFPATFMARWLRVTPVRVA